MLGEKPNRSSGTDMCLTIITQLLFDLVQVRPSDHSDSNSSPQLLKELCHVWCHTLNKQTNKNSHKSVLQRDSFDITQKVWLWMLLLLLYTAFPVSVVLRHASCVTHKSHAGKRNNPGPVAVLPAFLTISRSSPPLWQWSAESHTNCTSMKLHPVLPSHSKREMENWNFYSFAKPGGLRHHDLDPPFNLSYFYTEKY